MRRSPAERDERAQGLGDGRGVGGRGRGAARGVVRARRLAARLEPGAAARRAARAPARRGARAGGAPAPRRRARLHRRQVSTLDYYTGCIQSKMVTWTVPKISEDNVFFN